MTDFKGQLMLIMAPSGSGKKMLFDGLGDLADQLHLARTYTSRAKREGTEENSKYIFITVEEFEQMIAEDAFVEWANFSGNLYGTPKSEIYDELKKTQVVFKEMELQGVEQIKKIVPQENLTVIYVDAGSWEELQERVLARAPIDAGELELRRQRYEEESKFKEEADVIIYNPNGGGEAAQAHFREVVIDIIGKLDQ